MKKNIILLFLFIFTSTCFTGCTSLKEYNENIIFSLNENEVIIIKEYSLFKVTGAELYYKRDGEQPIFIGETGGADELLCPFKEGLYEIKQIDNTIVVSWCFKDRDQSKWRSKSFELPSE